MTVNVTDTEQGVELVTLSPNDALAETIRTFAREGLEDYDIARVVKQPVHRVRALKRRIPVDIKRATEMRRDGMSEHEIAYALGVSPSTIHLRFRELGIKPLVDLRRARNNPGPMMAAYPKRNTTSLWCPDVYLTEYQRLRVKLGAKEAKRIILEQIARDYRMSGAAS
jgi:AraC-like DNA-binding protein